MVSMANTIVGVFDDYVEAEQAQRELLSSGFEQREVRIAEQPAGQTEAGEEPGFWDNVREFFGMEDASYYEEASRRGGAVLTVSTSSEKIDSAVSILEQHHPVDVDRRAQQWRQSGWQGPQREQAQRRQQPMREGSTSGEQSIPVTEEQLRVGKRAEQRGGVRVYSHVRETPVEKDVNLREEHVDVKRRPADRPAGKDAFREQTIEAREMREEPVVEKEARVTEEVVVDKDVTERKGKVRDTVRKTDVEVERMDEDTPQQRPPRRDKR